MTAITVGMEIDVVIAIVIGISLSMGVLVAINYHIIKADMENKRSGVFRGLVFFWFITLVTTLLTYFIMRTRW